MLIPLGKRAVTYTRSPSHDQPHGPEDSHFAGGAAGAGVAGLGAAGAAVGVPPAAALRSPEWPWNVRVGANSPSLWPTMFSVTKTGRNFLPLCTAKVRPTISGRMVDRRDQVLMTFLPLVFTCSWTFFTRCGST